MSPNALPPHFRRPFPRILKSLRLPFHLHRRSPSRGAPHERRNDLPHPLQLLLLDLDLSPLNDPSTPPQCLVDTVQNLKQAFSPAWEVLGQGDLKIIGPLPIAAGGSSDVWIGDRGGTTVVIKAYRRYASCSCLPVFLRMCKEALTYSYLDGGEDFVPFVGVYSTRELPFCLVFEFMPGHSLRVYLGRNRDAEKVTLLLGAARGLGRLHSLKIVHSNFEINHLLVDGNGRTRITGLGMASIPSAMPVGDMVDQPPHATRAPELIDPSRWGLSDDEPTVASDIFAFATVVWEVFGGKPPYADRSVFAGKYSMVNGNLPDRSENPELSDRMWEMVRKCWESNPAERMTLPEVIALLEAEENAHQSK